MVNISSRNTMYKALCMKRGQTGAEIKKIKLWKHFTQVLFDVKIDIRNGFYAPENLYIPGFSSKYKFIRDIQSTWYETRSSGAVIKKRRPLNASDVVRCQIWHLQWILRPWKPLYTKFFFKIYIYKKLMSLLWSRGVPIFSRPPGGLPGGQKFGTPIFQESVTLPEHKSLIVSILLLIVLQEDFF